VIRHSWIRLRGRSTTNQWLGRGLGILRGTIEFCGRIVQALHPDIAGIDKAKTYRPSQTVESIVPDAAKIVGNDKGCNNE